MAVVAGVDNACKKLEDYSLSQVISHPILKKTTECMKEKQLAGYQ